MYHQWKKSVTVKMTIYSCNKVIHENLCLHWLIDFKHIDLYVDKNTLKFQM